jgi:cytochrome oxidase Cu insertion factor (SCO1/SenC/PrrC family)
MFRRKRGWSVVALCLAVGACTAPLPEDDFYPVGEFCLTERGEQVVCNTDLLGKVWVASFIFTRCAGPCARVSHCMTNLQNAFAGEPNVRLVTFSVDPEFDQPSVLRAYADRYEADKKQWLFLTGKPAEVYTLIRTGFHLTAEPNQGAAATPGNEIMHDTRLAIVDRRGHIRGYVQATEDGAVEMVKAKVTALLREKP